MGKILWWFSVLKSGCVVFLCWRELNIDCLINLEEIIGILGYGLNSLSMIMY